MNQLNAVAGARMASREVHLDGAPSWLSRLQRGQIVFGEGDPSSLMYRVESGCIRLQVNGDDGIRQIVSFLFSGDLFGYAVGERKVSAEAVSETVVRCWSISSVLALGARTPEIAVELVSVADHHFANVAHHLEKVTHLAATDRVKWFLSGLLNCDGLRKPDGRIELPMSRRDIADHLSLTPETLSRAINELENDGFLQRDGRRGFRLRGPSLELKVKSVADLGLD